VTYWGIVAVAAAALAAVGAAPAKVAILLAAAVAAARLGVRLSGPLLALAFVLPESGGARPAAVPHLALLLSPLALWTILGGLPAWLWRDRTVRAIGALAAALGCAAAVGLWIRDASASVVVFELFRSLLPMLAFVVFAAIPADRTMAAGSSSLGPWIAAGASMAAVLGMAQVLLGQMAIDHLGSASAVIGYPSRPFPDVQQHLWWGVRKAFAAFFSPNGLGAAAAFAVVFVVADWVRLGRMAPGWRMSAAGAIGGVLVLTFSRAALLSAAVLFTWLAWVAWRGRQRAHAGVCLAAALLLPIGYVLLLNQRPEMVASGSGAAETAARIKRETASMKIEEARSTLAMFGRGHLLGSGSGVIFDRVAAAFVSADRTIGISPAYAEVVYRSGIFGLGALLYAAHVFGGVWRRTREPLHERPAHLCPVRAALAAALVLSLIDHPFLTVPGTAVLFWAAWGLLVRQAHAGRARQP
jgi:hypothetical protein